jgi:hypothetical protein
VIELYAVQWPIRERGGLGEVDQAEKGSKLEKVIRELTGFHGRQVLVVGTVTK